MLDKQQVWVVVPQAGDGIFKKSDSVSWIVKVDKQAYPKTQLFFFSIFLNENPKQNLR